MTFDIRESLSESIWINNGSGINNGSEEGVFGVFMKIPFKITIFTPND